jgi:hypothetical protein
LVRIRGDETDTKLLSRDVDGMGPWLDPRDPIDEARIEKAAARLKVPAEEIRRRYKVLANEFGLRIVSDSEGV